MIRLTHAHIDNFGVLSGLDLDFESGINMYCRENGWGKSTFAAFLQIMFYGMEGNRKKAIEDRDREKYRPWQGGTFGGKLRFLYNDKEYEITRVFGKKESEDLFELRDVSTNLVSEAFDSNIGRELFGIDKESFLKTIFIGQSNCSTAVTDDIRSMIGGVILQDEDRMHYDKAEKDLKDLQNKLTPDKKTGSLYKRKQLIREEEYHLLGENDANLRLTEAVEKRRSENEALQSIDAELRENRTLLADIVGKREMLAEKKNWEQLRLAETKATEEALAFRAKLPGNVPDLQQVSTLIGESGELESLQNEAKIYTLSREEEDRLRELSIAFAAGKPSEEMLQEMLQKDRLFTKLEAESAGRRMSEQDRQKLTYYKEYFGGDTENITTVLAGWNLRNTKQVARQATETSIQMVKITVANENNKLHTKKIQGIVCAVLGLALGILCIAMHLLPVGIALILLGLAGAGILFWMSGKASPELTTAREGLAYQEKLLAEDREYVEQCDRKTESYLLAHGRAFEESTVEASLQEIAGEYTEYKSLLEAEAQASASENREEREKLSLGLETFLASYVSEPYDTFTGALYGLREKTAALDALSEKKRRFVNADTRYKTLKGRIEEYIASLGFTPAEPYGRQLIALRDMTDDYLDAENLRLQAAEKAEQFRNSHDMENLENLQEDDIPEPGDLNERYLELNSQRELVLDRRDRLGRTVEELSRTLGEIEECKIRLEELKKEQEREERRYKYVCLARTKLREACESITARYTGPVLQSFLKYIAMIDADHENTYYVDANFNVNMEAFGSQHTCSLLSAGYKDLVGICLRVSLADAMYKGEKPLLILDDPFTNLDDAKIAETKLFLEKLSEQYQILYFTCSNSRL